MITAIRPYTPQNTQRQNFCAVNQTWLKKLVADPGIINNKFGDEMVRGDISLDDSIDTLTAAKTLLEKGFHEAFDDEITWARKQKEINAGAKK